MLHFNKLLKSSLADLDINVDNNVIHKSLEYLELLLKWNKRFNLTAITDPGEAVVKHLVDSLTLLPHLKGDKVIDIGTGAGLPGILLAISCPDKNFTLLDSQQKRIHFVQHAATTLQLDNVTAIHSRVEDFSPDTGFDFVVSRAFSCLKDFVNCSSHLLAEGGKWIAMKGVLLEDETSTVSDIVNVLQVIELLLPKVEAKRSLVFMEPKR